MLAIMLMGAGEAYAREKDPRFSAVLESCKKLSNLKNKDIKGTFLCHTAMSSVIDGWSIPWFLFVHQTPEKELFTDQGLEKYRSLVDSVYCETGGMSPIKLYLENKIEDAAALIVHRVESDEYFTARQFSRMILLCSMDEYPITNKKEM